MTWADVLLDLPVDGVLHQFFEQEGLSVPTDFEWLDTTAASRVLIELVLKTSDSGLRDQISARLTALARLDHLKGRQAMFEMAESMPDVRSRLASCRSDLHRALWLSMSYPMLYERAEALCQFDTFENLAQQYELGVKTKPDLSKHAIAALEAEVSSFYLCKQNAGQACVSFVHERESGVYFVGLRIKDLISLNLEFDGIDLIRRESSPCIAMSLDYSSRTGVARVLTRCGVEYQQCLVKAFVRHLLKVTLTLPWLPPPTLDLSKLRLGFIAPKAVIDGFTLMRVRSFTFISPDQQLRVDCCALEADVQSCVANLLTKKMPDAIEQEWLISAAQIDLYCPPLIDGRSPRVLTVQLTSKGRLNLPRFNRVLQTQIEGYLLEAGVMQPYQTLCVVE
jgi:hypothetical protein